MHKDKPGVPFEQAAQAGKRFGLGSGEDDNLRTELLRSFDYVVYGEDLPREVHFWRGVEKLDQGLREEGLPHDNYTLCLHDASLDHTAGPVYRSQRAQSMKKEGFVAGLKNRRN